jgi:hypothetical protein
MQVNSSSLASRLSNWLSNRNVKGKPAKVLSSLLLALLTVVWLCPYVFILRRLLCQGELLRVDLIHVAWPMFAFIYVAPQVAVDLKRLVGRSTP